MTMNDDLINGINNMAEQITRQIVEFNEKVRLKILSENQIICGSPFIKADIETIFPGIEVFYSPLCDENLVLLVRKMSFDKGMNSWEGEKNEK